MKKLLLVLLAGLLLGTDAAADDAEIKEVEKAITVLNEAFKNRDAVAIERLLTEDHTAVTAYYGGPQTRAQQLKSLPDLKLTEYATGKYDVTLLSKDVALVTYALKQKGTFQGKEVPRRSYASALWVNRGGKWREAFYQETPLEGD